MKVRLQHRTLAAAAVVVATSCYNDVFCAQVMAQVAPPSPTANTSDDASLAEADRLRASGDLAGALRLYRAAQAKQGNLGISRRIAETEDQLGQYGAAYVEYAALLDRYGSLLEPTQKRLIEARLRDLDQATGMLLLEPIVAGTVVRIDGRPIPFEQLSRPIRVARGNRRIDVEQPAYKPLTLTENIGPSMTRVALQLERLPSTGLISVSALSAASAVLYVDEKPVGPLPQRMELSPGEHVLRADGPVVYAEPFKVVISANKPQDLTLTLLSKQTVLDVDPVAPDSVLYVDEKPVGKGPHRIELAPGKHRLELRRPGYKSQRLSFDARPGLRQSLTAAAYVREPNATTPKVAALPVEDNPPPPTEPVPNALPAHAAKAPENSEEEGRFQGIYGALVVPVMLGGVSTHSYTTNCPADAYSGACSTSAPRGGGLGLRLGYFYEWVGLEVFAAGAVDVSTADLKLPPIPSVSQQMLDLAGRNVFVRAGGLIGGGIRLSTPIQGIRVTVGADYVHVARKVFAIPDAFTGTSLAYSVPGYFIDGGIQLGSTPGARFYLGAFLFIETAHDLALNRNLKSLGIDPALIPASLTSMTVYQGRQYFFGPLLGIAFGH